MNVPTLLLDLLEELSGLEGTLVSTSSHDITMEKVTPLTSETQGAVSNLSISTPQRLRDLQIVSERLAVLRKKNENV